MGLACGLSVKVPNRHVDRADRADPGAASACHCREGVESIPIWKLLGGAPQEFITPYASLIPSGKTLATYREGLLKKLVWARDYGFKAAKLEICIKGPYSHNSLQEDDEAIVELSLQLAGKRSGLACN